MAFDERLAERVAILLSDATERFAEKKMFGGVAFMVRKKMCLGVVKDDLMVRFDPALQEEVIARPGAREMDFTRRPMKGFVFVSPDGTNSTARLRGWVALALSFNPKAKRSRARKKATHR